MYNKFDLKSVARVSTSGRPPLAACCYHSFCSVMVTSLQVTRILASEGKFWEMATVAAVIRSGYKPSLMCPDVLQYFFFFLFSRQAHLLKLNHLAFWVINKRLIKEEKRRRERRWQGKWRRERMGENESKAIPILPSLSSIAPFFLSLSLSLLLYITLLFALTFCFFVVFSSGLFVFSPPHFHLHFSALLFPLLHRCDLYLLIFGSSSS